MDDSRGLQPVSAWFSRHVAFTSATSCSTGKLHGFKPEPTETSHGGVCLKWEETRYGSTETSIASPCASRHCWLMCSSISLPSRFAMTHAILIKANHHNVELNTLDENLAKGDIFCALFWPQCSGSRMLRSHWRAVLQYIRIIKPLNFWHRIKWLDWQKKEKDLHSFCFVGNSLARLLMDPGGSRVCFTVHETWSITTEHFLKYLFISPAGKKLS